MSQQPEGRPDLRADCAQCAGLCCVALALTVSDDFAIDKPAGQPCPNLKHDFRCGIHARLEDGGFPGCTVYDCFGAGQKVTQVTFGGRDWRQAVDSGALMFEVFSVVRLLHELLWYLTEALALAPALRDDLQRALDDTERHNPAARSRWQTWTSSSTAHASTRCCCVPARPSAPASRPHRQAAAARISSARLCEAPTCATWIYAAPA